jgi:hypothetical protein
MQKANPKTLQRNGYLFVAYSNFAYMSELVITNNRRENY